ncbi:hypothetical protein NC653_013902 [Populus alba x Populus x berolinensis]|uniref:Uncharacterized protein n=1 Tax=Populus alba x Populus x berolinensis TaxID=444605 RepID=A0AAD6QVP5_9ROSI|nr:hypothetical protein NC653_013902 [Populus alba x Populus x berolinensis]
MPSHNHCTVEIHMRVFSMIFKSVKILAKGFCVGKLGLIDVMLSKKHIVIDSERLVLLKKVNQVSINVGKEDLETSQVIPDHIFRRKRGKKKNYNRIECKKHMKRKIGESGRDDWLLEFLIHLSETRGLTSGETPRDSGSYPLSHHYSVLGLDRFRMNFRGLEQHNILEAVIKTAFRTKEKEFHPDQNQDNKVLAFVIFLLTMIFGFRGKVQKKVMISYEAILCKEKKTNTKFKLPATGRGTA